MADKPKIGVPGTLGGPLEFLRDRYRGRFDFREYNPVVGVTLVNIVGINFERVSLTFVNFGAADVIVAPNQLVAINRGIRVAAGGGIVSLDVTEDGLLPCLEWYGISSGAGNIVYAVEVYRYLAEEVQEPRV